MNPTQTEHEFVVWFSDWPCENGNKQFSYVRADLLSASQDGFFCMYSRIPVSSTHGTGHVLYYQTFQIIKTVPLLTNVLAGNLLLLVLCSGYTTNHRSIPYGYLLQLLVQGNQGPVPCFLEHVQFVRNRRWCIGRIHSWRVQEIPQWLM
jgi:hypothetical protein